MGNGLPIPAKKPEGDPSEFPPALIHQFLQNQEKELEIRKQGLDIQKQQEANSFEYSKRALDAEAADRKHRRETQQGSLKAGFVFLGVCLFALIGLIAFALYRNKDEFIIEMVKFMGAFFCGGAGGFAIGRRKTAPAPQPNGEAAE